MALRPRPEGGRSRPRHYDVGGLSRRARRHAPTHEEHRAIPSALFRRPLRASGLRLRPSAPPRRLQRPAHHRPRDSGKHAREGSHGSRIHTHPALQLHAADPGTARSTAAQVITAGAEFSASGSLAEGAAVILRVLSAKLALSLPASAQDIDSSKPILQYGVDSLTAVELRNWFAKELKTDVAIFDILGGSSTDAISL